MASIGAKFCRNTQNLIPALIIMLFSSQILAQQLLDRVVAVVEEEAILMSEVNEKVKTGPLVVISDYPVGPKANAFERALHDSINYELMKAAADDLGIEVTEDEIDAQIEKILKNQGADRKQLMAFLKEQGKTFEEYRDDFRDQMILRRFQGRVIMPLVKISEEQIRSYYLEKSGKNAETATLDIIQLLVPVDPNSNSKVVEVKTALVEDAYQKILGGMAFEEAAKLYVPGGKLSNMRGVKVSNLSEQIKIEVQNLEPGQTSRPVKTNMGIHLFYVSERKFSGNSSYLKAKRQLEYELRNREINTQLRVWLESERQKRNVSIID